jgi:hypothetical protein
MQRNTTDGEPVGPAVPGEGGVDAPEGRDSGRDGVATEAELRLPASAVALDEAFRSEPSLTCRVEAVASGRPDRPFAHTWVGGVERETLRETLHADPSVELREIVTEGNGRWLCDLGFDPAVRLVTTVIGGESGVVRAAAARSGTWRFHLWYPDRTSVGETVATLDGFGIDTDLRQIRMADGQTDRRLTRKQRETVEAAYRRGYFDVPRQVSLKTLADELDVSHQALSERLRRALTELLRFELDQGAGQSRPV